MSSHDQHEAEVFNEIDCLLTLGLTSANLECHAGLALFAFSQLS